jgi:hypothetical protein
MENNQRARDTRLGPSVSGSLFIIDQVVSSGLSLSTVTSHVNRFVLASFYFWLDIIWWPVMALAVRVLFIWIGPLAPRRELSL